MKKIIAVFFCVVIGFAVFFLLRGNRKDNFSFQTSFKNTSETSTPSLGQEEKGLFVPYWTLANLDTNGYTKFYYFGVAADENGVDKSEQGFINLKTFVSQTKGAQTYLVVRMVNSRVNDKILSNAKSQKTIAQNAASIARQNGFAGVVLDFELSALGFESVTNNVSAFYKTFSDVSKQNNLKFLVTLYGDTFYAGRPYDVKTIAKISDAVLVMAYDFHKSNGADPGPNFQLNGRDTYGYDFKQMTNDFTKEIPKEKLTVVFGMFGYDWTVDEKNRSEKQATPLSDLEIKQKFLGNCMFSDCKITRDSESAEEKVLYTDSLGKNHVVWFEDQSSVDQKEKYLRSQGINSFAFWANSYF
ncbi:MAG TPA: glycosyl hydrolase family 18 protein [Candidatus Saccharimonadales bacterium]|nr:glycosyl hydrolase family 18 protein [Candidatus Saccharimonadales bacterium]